MIITNEDGSPLFSVVDTHTAERRRHAPPDGTQEHARELLLQIAQDHALYLADGNGELSAAYRRLLDAIQALPREQQPPDLPWFWAQGTGLPHVTMAWLQTETGQMVNQSTGRILGRGPFQHVTGTFRDWLEDWQCTTALLADWLANRLIDTLGYWTLYPARIRQWSPWSYARPPQMVTTIDFLWDPRLEEPEHAKQRFLTECLSRWELYCGDLQAAGLSTDGRSLLKRASRPNISRHAEWYVLHHCHAMTYREIAEENGVEDNSVRDAVVAFAEFAELPVVKFKGGRPPGRKNLHPGLVIRKAGNTKAD